MKKLILLFISVFILGCAHEGTYYVDSTVLIGRVSHINEGFSGVRTYGVRTYKRHEIYIQSETKTEIVRLEPSEKILWKVGDSVTLMINNYKENCDGK